MLNQFENLSCYEELEIRSTLFDISKIDILKEIGHQIDSYYFFISEDGIFNWFDLKGNHIKDPGILKELNREYIPKTISKCIIPDSVTCIGFEAFWDCSALKEIVIPSSITRIDYRAFSHCYSLKEITIPDSVTHISTFVFSFCTSLTSITIPDSVISIGYKAFHFCTALTSVTISRNIQNIKFDAFFGCNAIKEVIFKGKTLDEVKQMWNYPFGIKDESIIKCEM